MDCGVDGGGGGGSDGPVDPWANVERYIHPLPLPIPRKPRKPRDRRSEAERSSQTILHKIAINSKSLCNCRGKPGMKMSCFHCNFPKALRKCIRNRLTYSWKREGKPRTDSKTQHAMVYLGCSGAEYKLYLGELLAAMAPLNGEEVATFANLGQWHIDHIRPILSFDFAVEDDYFSAFNYGNTQPLWSSDNLRKADSFDPETQTKKRVSSMREWIWLL